MPTLNLTNTSSAAVLFGSTSTPNASILGSSGSGPGLYLSGGNHYNGTNWIADTTISSLLSVTNGGLSVSYNSGLTVGASYTPTQAFLIDANGADLKSGNFRLNGVSQGVTVAFTPTLAGDSTAGSATYTIQVGSYAIFGSRVHVQTNLQTSAQSGMGGNLVINGLPFTSSSTANNTASCSVGVFQGFSWGTTALTQMAGRINSNTTSIQLLLIGNNTAAALLPIAAMASGGVSLQVACDYLK
jgi:hypothetical protein